MVTLAGFIRGTHYTGCQAGKMSTSFPGLTGLNATEFFFNLKNFVKCNIFKDFVFV